MLENSIYAGGLFSLFCAVLHVFFPKMFRWNRVAGQVDEEDRRMLLVQLHIMNGCILVFFIIFAAMAFIGGADMAVSATGKVFLVSMLIFWMLRSSVQAILIIGALKQGVSFSYVAGPFIGLVVFIIGIVCYAIPVRYM